MKFSPYFNSAFQWYILFQMKLHNDICLMYVYVCIIHILNFY